MMIEDLWEPDKPDTREHGSPYSYMVESKHYSNVRIVPDGSNF